MSCHMFHICYLNLAAKFGSTEILKILLQYFDANVQDQSGYLPIDKAMFHQRIEAIKILAPFTKELRVHEFFVKYGCAKEVALVTKNSQHQMV